MGSGRRGVGVVAFGCPEIGEVIGYGFFRPGVVESLACETLVHLSHDRVEAFRIAKGWIIHYRVSIELRVSVRNSMCMHEFHSLNEESL